jgi:O-antigen/teichoic acid export membrane protein
MVLGPVSPRRAVVRSRSDAPLTWKASLNSLTAGLEYGAHVLVGFFLGPLLIAGLGVQGYGVWQVLRQLVGYLSPATGRPSEALQWSIAGAQSSDDHEQKHRYVGSALVISIAALPGLAILGAALVWFAPSWLGVPPELVASTRVATGLLVASLALAPIVTLPRTVLAGQNLAYKRMGLSALIVLIGGALTALALHLGTGLAGVAAVPLVTLLLTGALGLQVARRHVPWFGIAWPPRSALRRFFDLTLWFLSWRAIVRLAQASDLVVLGTAGSITLVSSYALTKFAPESLVALVGIVVAGSTPGLGGIFGAGDLPKARLIRAEIMTLTWLVATTAAVTILLWNQVFVHLWIGPEHFSGAVPNLLITLMMVQWAFIGNDANIIDLTLDLRAKVLTSACSAILSLVLAVLLVGPLDWGIAGLCLGFIAGRLVLTVAYPLVVGRAFKIAWSTQLAATLRPAATTATLLALAISLVPYAAAAGWVGLVIGVTGTLVVAGVVGFLAGLSRPQRARVLNRLRQTLPA